VDNNRFFVQAANPSAKDLEIFLTEVRTLSKLHHRNIVQFYGACLDPDRAMFFVTELMKGGDLYSALRHHPETMRWDKLGKKVALDVALGINYLHSRRPPLLHRDLKSPNVLLSEEGVAKIADVGMVRSQVKELVTAQPVMTPLWAAPEVSCLLPLCWR
jgi:serine/threonine protein kinase